MKTCHTRTPGAQRRLRGRNGVSTFHQKIFLLDASTGALLYCGAYLFSTTPCVRWPPTHPSQLAPITLLWAALSLPLSCSGFLTRNDVSRPCSGGAKASRCFTFKLFRSLLHWLPTYPGQLEPTALPQCRLAPDSCSVGLSPPLSLSLSLSHPLSLSLSLLLSGPPPIAPHSLSLSPSHKGGFRTSVDLYPPRGSNPPPQDRRGAVYPLSYDEWLLFRPFLFPPACHSLSSISPFAWGCAQQRVEEPHSISGYRVRLPEECSLEQP